jgi:hypothetical protein
MSPRFLARGRTPERIAQICILPDIPVIYLTAFVDRKMFKRVSQTQALGSLRQPFESPESQPVVTASSSTGFCERSRPEPGCQSGRFRKG